MSKYILTPLAILLLTGCATEKKLDWHTNWMETESMQLNCESGYSYRHFDRQGNSSQITVVCALDEGYAGQRVHTCDNFVEHRTEECEMLACTYVDRTPVVFKHCN